MEHEDLILLDLGDLVEVQGHWGLAFEDRNQYDQLCGIQLDFRDGCRHGFERSVVHDDRFANFEVHGDLSNWSTAWLRSRRLLYWVNDGVFQHGEHFIKAQWVWIVGIANESGNTWSVSNNTPRSVGQLHANQDVARDAHAANDLAL